VADSVLIIAPLLILAAVLLLGFAGCSFEHGRLSRNLILRARVPLNLTVVDGVKFTYVAPGDLPQETSVAMPGGQAPSVKTYIDSALNLDATLAAGPSLLWTLGTDGGLTDRSPNGHHGTALGAVQVGGEANAPTEFTDATATLFDGANDGIGSSYNPFVGTTARTFVGWARWEAGGPAEYTLFGSSAANTDRPTLRVEVASRDVKWLPSGSDGGVFTWPAAAPPEDTWFMWALRANPGNKATLFIDGGMVAEQSMTDDWPANPGSFQIGLGATGQQPFKGSQGLIAVYEDGLTNTQVANLYQASRVPHSVVYELKLEDVELGSWLARCGMKVEADAQPAEDSSPDFPFEISTKPYTPSTYLLLFQAEGSPVGPVTFEVKVVGLV
jgi:hypothetical protein